MKRLFMVLVALGAITWFGASATTATAGGHGYRGYGPQYGHHGPQHGYYHNRPHHGPHYRAPYRAPYAYPAYRPAYVPYRPGCGHGGYGGYGGYGGGSYISFGIGF